MIQSRFHTLLVSGCSFTARDFGDHDHYWNTLLRCYRDIRDSSWPDIRVPQDWDRLDPEVKHSCENMGLDWQHLTYVTWPVYLRDLLAIPRFIDTSASSAGNQHIHQAVILALEQEADLDAKGTLVVVMWSGWDRDDFLASADAVMPGRRDVYRYTHDTVCVSTGSGLGPGNGIIPMDAVKKIKDHRSRALENFVQIQSLRRYLDQRGITAIFTHHSNQPWEQSFDVTANLPDNLRNIWQQLFDINLCLGDMAQDTIDGSHPTPQWHRIWAQSVLMDHLISKGIA